MSLDFYPPAIHEGDLSPGAAAFEVDEICKEIRAFTKGAGCDSKSLLKTMGSMEPEIRCVLPKRYEELYEKNLVELIKSETSGDFGTALQLLSADPVTADCMMVHKACKGLGTDEHILLSIVLGRSNAEMEILKKKYYSMYSEDLSRKLSTEMRGDLDKLVTCALQAAEEEYDPDFHTDALAQEDAENFYKMGQGKWGTDEQGLFQILCGRPPKHLRAVNLLYTDKRGVTLIKALEKELSGYSETAATFVVGMKLRPYEEIAKLIKAACRGLGTNELLLTTALIRYQGVMRKVSEAHQELFNKSIRDRVNSECSGDYRRVLMEIIEASEN